MGTRYARPTHMQTRMLWWSQFSAFKPNGLRISQLSAQNQDQRLILPQVTPLQHIGFPTGSQDIQLPTFQKDRSTGFRGIINRIRPRIQAYPPELPWLSTDTRIGHISLAHPTTLIWLPELATHLLTLFWKWHQPWISSDRKELLFSHPPLDKQLSQESEYSHPFLSPLLIILPDGVNVSSPSFPIARRTCAQIICIDP